MKFRSKPIVVEAVHFLDVTDLPAGVRAIGSTVYKVKTIHGQWALIEVGDWVITESDGEHHYPCKDDIFRKRYEPVLSMKAERVEGLEPTKGNP